jgi:hypothetical protein
MRVSQAIYYYFASVDNVGNKFNRNVHWVAGQIGAKYESDLEFGRIDGHVPHDVERSRR